MTPHPEEIRRVILTALAEDIGRGDITTENLIPAGQKAKADLVAKEPLVVCGIALMAGVFQAVDETLDYVWTCDDGTQVAAGTRLATISGNARAILTAERVALNLLQRLCGIATATAAYVHAVAGTGAAIADTRKTVPGLRELDKYAVKTGGGKNHRMRLDDGMLIKDNHIALCGSIEEALGRAAAASRLLTGVEVECDTLQQVEAAIASGATMLLLDNMDIPTLQKAVEIAGGRAVLEASGNVTLESVRQVAQTGVHIISVGRLTHSVKAADISLELAPA